MMTNLLFIQSAYLISNHGFHRSMMIISFILSCKLLLIPFSFHPRILSMIEIFVDRKLLFSALTPGSFGGFKYTIVLDDVRSAEARTAIYIHDVFFDRHSRILLFVEKVIYLYR